MSFLPISVPADARETVASVEDYKKLVENCLSGIMVLGQNKQTIKRADLTKLIYTGTRTHHHTITKALIALANHDLHKYVGMRLYHDEEIKGFLLVNSTTIPNQCRKELSQEECDELASIFVALMEIFSSADESSTEAHIKEAMSVLDFSEDQLKTCFDMLIKKLYIVQVKNSAYQPEERLYKWGPRAIAEVDPDRFMKSFLDLAESGTADDWPDQKRRIELLKSVQHRSIGA